MWSWEVTGIELSDNDWKMLKDEIEGFFADVDTLRSIDKLNEALGRAKSHILERLEEFKRRLEEFKQRLEGFRQDDYYY